MARPSGATLRPVLLLWLLPGLLTLALVRRDARRLADANDPTRQPSPLSGWRAFVIDELWGPVVVGAALVGWPLVLLRREQCAHWAAQRTWLVGRPPRSTQT